MQIDDNLYYFTNAVLASLQQSKNYLLFIMSFYLGAAGTWFISKASMRLILMDVPNTRSSHNVPVPRGGGLGIFLVVVLAGLALRMPTHFLFPIILLSIVTFYGDFFQLSIRTRLIIQFVSAIIIIFPSLPQLIPASLAVSTFFYFLILFGMLLFMVGTANFYNFMDGINGMAGISGAIAFCLLGLFGSNAQHASSFGTFPIFSFCVALACLGFLPFNMPKAKVFMGDVGSILLGFVFAGLVVKLSHNILDFICLSAFLFPFYADELTTMVVRIRDGERFGEPHRRHLYQLLANENGIPHWKISVLYGVAQILVASTVILARPWGILFVISQLATYLIIFACISFYFRRKLAARQ